MKVLCLLADSVRADYLGCYDRARHTPTIDRIAAEGVRFTTAMAAAPWTIPAVAGLLTGVWAHRLGLFTWEQPWSVRVPTLFDYARGAGLSAASFVFEPSRLFAGCPAAGVVGSSQDTDAMLGWFRAHRREDWFVFLHYWWTHLPYLEQRLRLDHWRAVCDAMLANVGHPQRMLAEAHRERCRALYAAAIETLSEKWLPAILDAARPDIVVLTADHGESWGERMDAARPPRRIFDLHGNHLHDEVLRVPLILWAPRLLPPATVRGLVRSIDVAPTVLELLGIREHLAPMAGSSLLPAIAAGHPPEPRLAMVSRSRDFLDQNTLPTSVAEAYLEFACRSDDFKVFKAIDRDDPVGYDLRGDPGELFPIPLSSRGEPLAGGMDQHARRSFPDLTAALAEEIDRATIGSFSEADLRCVREQLQALGYL